MAAGARRSAGCLTTASRGPIVVAGSIVSAAQIQALSTAGAWGFTIGGAAFENVLPAEPTIRAEVEWALERRVPRRRATERVDKPGARRGRVTSIARARQPGRVCS